MQDEVGSTNVHFFSLTLTPVSPFFLLLCSAIISSLSYLEIEEERKGGNIDSSAYPVARQQQ